MAAWRPPELGHVPTSADIAASSIGLNEAALQEAHRAGWMEGHASAMAERAVASEETSMASQAAAVALREVADRLRAEVASTINVLSVAIARHLIEREIAQDPTLLQTLIGRALALAPMSGAVTVRMHPEDLAALNAAGGLLDAPQTGIELRWLADREISHGSCVVDGPHGIIDGRIDRALLDIYDQLTHD